MQTVRIVQAVGLMMIVAMAASCAASKEYTSKLFAPRTPEVKDSQATALRFFEFDAEADKKDWVTTDIIMGRDTVSKTLALDNFSKLYPASPVKTNSVKSDPAKPETVMTATKTAPAESEPVAKNANPGEVRNKKTRE